MEWAGFAVGAGGLAIAGLALVLTYRERVATMRGALYARQLDAYEQLVGALSQLHSAAVRLIAEGGHRLVDDAARIDFRTQVAGLHSSYSAVVERHRVVLPRAVIERSGRYTLVLLAISAPSAIANQYDTDVVEADDPAMLLSNAYRDLFEEVRSHVGTDPLGAQTLRLIGGRVDVAGG